MTSPPPHRTWLLSYGLLYGVLAAMMVVALWQGYRRSVFVSQPPQVQERPPDTSLDVLGLIDPNTAEWHELALLPGLGKTTCQQIVAYRQARQLEWQTAHPDRPPQDIPPVFTKAEDLLPIKGVGARMLERIRPHLRLPQNDMTAEPAHPVSR